MSRNDYTKYARDNRTETPATEVEVKVETPVEPDVIETPVEPAVEPVIETIVETEPVVEEPDAETETVHTMGYVTGCTRLNVRKAPKPRAEVVCEINRDTEVEIDEEQSTVDFYKICTASGVEGYCVKTYITKK